MRCPLAITKVICLFGKLSRDLTQLSDIISISRALTAAASKKDLDDIVSEFRSYPLGPSALEQKPKIGSLDLKSLRAFPRNSLGEAFGRFLHDRSLDPSDIPGVGERQEIDYILTHFYETHDIWHVVTGFDTDVAGELGLQAFYLAQTRTFLPFFVLAAALLNTAVFAYDEKSKRLDAITRGWNLGKQAKKLAGFDWLSNFQRPLGEVREELNLCS